MMNKKIPLEVRNLLNPAFNSVILYSLIKAYKVYAKKSVSYPILFILLPLILHKSTRESLPSRTKTKLHIWIKNNPQIQIDFARRVKDLVPYIKGAILFGIQNKLFRLEKGRFLANEISINLPWEDGSDCSEIKSKAEFLGKWLSRFEDPFIFSALGVQP